MSLIDELSFGVGARLPVVLQTEAAECGLACLAMIAGFHGHRIDLATLRSRHGISLKGTTLDDLMRIAGELKLACRPLRLELNELRQLQRPCVLHWRLNHFVVLRDSGPRGATVHDPAVGKATISMEELSANFTGVALELWPDPGFQRRSELRRFTFRELLGRVTGLFRSLGQVLLLALCLEIFTLVSPLFLQWVIDEAVVAADRDLVTMLALGFGLLMAVRVLTEALRSWILMYMSTTLNIQWRANAFNHLLRLPVQYFQKRHLGDVQSRFGSIDRIQNTLTTTFVSAILDGLMSAVTLTMMFVYSRTLGTIAAVTMVLYGLSRWAWYGSLKAATSSQIVFAAKQETHFLESIRGIRTLKLFQREDQRRTTWLALLVDQINAGLRTQKLQVLYGSLNSFLTGLESILVVWIGARMIIDGDFSIGMLMAFKSYNDQFQSRLSGLIDKFMQFQMLKLHGERLADIVLTDPEPGYATEGAHGQALAAASISVSNLRFRYAEHESFVLDGVNFQIAAGESVAIVGPSGCGKSTLISVILGVLPPTTGDIHIGGVSLKAMGAQGLRPLVGTVMQDDVLFAGSIADNISFFDPHADRAWIEECARKAAVHDDISAMPMGYNSLVGDMGTILSGGQKQRVLLARALYKRPKLLLLDEATSHLDLERERLVSESIKALNITRLLIAHRPETIASADRILLLQEGRIVEQTPTRRQQKTPLDAGLALESTSLPNAPSILRLTKQ